VTFLSVRTYVSQAGFVGVLSGLIVRRGYKQCWTFGVYLLLVWLGDLVGWLTPSFYTWDFWFAKEGLVVALKLLIAFELYLRLFAGLPGARRFANWPLFGLLLLTLAMLGKPNLHTDPVTSYNSIVPVATLGTTLILTLTLGLAAWYRVPASPIQRAILRGLVPYQLISTLGMHAFAIFGSLGRDLYNAVVPISYDIMLLYWTAIVWLARDDASATAPDAVVRRLRRWAWS
jgi:hypothetical protein